MATNLVSSVMQFLTPDMIARIASALGLSRNDTQSGITAAVPALLAMFGNAAAKPGGAQGLVDTIKQQSSMLDNFAGMIGGSGASSYAERGSNVLGSLLGAQNQSMLAGVIDRFSGLGTNTSNSLLGMLTPVIMGLIGKQFGAGNLNPANLMNLFSSQKDQIAQAMPAGMGNLLNSTGLVDSLSGFAGSATAAAGQAGRAASTAAGQVSDYASAAARSAGAAGQRAAGAASSGVPTWAFWVIPLALIAGIVWYMLSDRTEQVATRTPAPTTVANQMSDSAGVTRQINDSLADVRGALTSITDPASARAAMPKLESALGQLDKVGSAIGQLPAEQQQSVRSVIAVAMTTIDQLFNKVMAIPGVAEVLDPTASRVRTKLADLAGLPSTVGGGR
jgi:hypothetical protein